MPDAPATRRREQPVDQVTGRPASRHAEYQIDHPTAAGVRAWVSAVLQDGRFRTAGFLQQIGQ
jgi:hypothetical protein